MISGLIRENAGRDGTPCRPPGERSEAGGASVAMHIPPTASLRSPRTARSAVPTRVSRVLALRDWSALFVFLTLVFFRLTSTGAEKTNGPTSVIIAVGASGEEAYADDFTKWAAHWQKAGAAGHAKVQTIGAGADEKFVLTKLRAAVVAEAKTGTEPLWLVLLGHGTFDGRDGKFNLRGDDVAASELAEWLKPCARPVVIVCGFSASGAFLKPLSAPGRVIVTATKSGAENNFARFGGYFAEAVADAAADLDHDGQTSVLEAWLAAAQRTAEFYKTEGRIATEHSLLEDNGDGLGTPAEWYAGLRVVKKTKDGKAPDGLRASQFALVPSETERGLSPERRAQRDALEAELAKLREAKAALPEKEYFAQLEALLLRIARVYPRR